MNEKQILIVKYSWSYVANRLDDTQTLFIKNLLRLLPHLKPILKERINQIGPEQIMRTIHQMVAMLPNFNETEIQKMQTEYAAIGISPSDYDSALFAFLMTLEKKASKTWSNEVRESWVFVFASIHQSINERNRKVVA